MLSDKEGIIKNFYIKNNGEKISCTLVYQKKPHSKALVIMPGLGAPKDISSKSAIVPEIIKNGIDVIMFDFMGHGKSPGNFADITFTSMSLYLETVINYLYSTKRREVAIWASSSPCIAAAFIASKMKIHSLVLQSPIFDLKEYIIFTRGLDGLKYWEKTGYIYHPGSMGKKRLNYQHYIDSLKFRDISSYLPFIKTKTLIIGAGKDQYYPMSETKKIVKLIPNNEFIVIEKADHLFAEQKKQLFDLVTQYIIKSLNNI